MHFPAINTTPKTVYSPLTAPTFSLTKKFLIFICNPVAYSCIFAAYMMNTYGKKRNSKQFSDVLGMGSAILCMIHCLAAPVLLSLGVNLHSEGSSFFLHESWEILFLSLGFIAVWFSSKHSQTPLLKATLWITYGFLLCSIVFVHDNPVFEYAIYASSLLLIIAHSFNLRKLSQQKSALSLNCDC